MMRNISKREARIFRFIIIPVLIFTLIIWGSFFAFLNNFKVKTQMFLNKYFINKTCITDNVTNIKNKNHKITNFLTSSSANPYLSSKKFLENKTFNLFPSSYLENYFNSLFIFALSLAMAVYVLGLFLIYLTATYVSKEKEKSIKKFLENLKLICFNENKLDSNLFNEIVKLVFYDPLTHAYNRKYFFYILEKEVERAKRFNHPLSLIYIDLDDFKKINDTYGHLVGDELLKFFSSLISRNIRKVDIFARLGGEEFAILLPEMTLEDAVKVANKILNLIKNANFKNIKLSASIGVTTLKENDTPKSFLKRADRAMYLAKKSGKGKIKIL